MIKQIFDALLYSVFPRRCRLCGQVVEIDRPICEECEHNEKIDGELCLKCGCLKSDCCCGKSDKKPSYKAVVAPFYYSKGIKRGMHRLKFFGYKELAPNIAREMAESVSREYSDIHFDYVTFVPMTKRKLRKRGYNQAELLASATAKIINADCLQLLDKIRETESQRSNSAKARKTNLYGAFDLHEGADVKGKTILLVDDVKTTGSTLNECSEVLKAYGASGVYACVGAITKLEKRGTE